MICLSAVRISIDLPFNFRLKNITKRYNYIYFSPNLFAVIDLSLHTLMPIEIFMIYTIMLNRTDMVELNFNFYKVF